MFQRLHVATAGESHGPAMVLIFEGLPAGISIEPAVIDAALRRRRHGYGRSSRQKKETDDVRIVGGVRHGRTIGAPVAVIIENRDHEAWGDRVSAAVVDEDKRGKKVTIPRPGHADLAALKKYNLDDVRDALERASARETVMRVVAGAFAEHVLAAVGIEAMSHVIATGGASSPAVDVEPGATVVGLRQDDVRARFLSSLTGCLDADASARMVAAVDAADTDGDSLGGVVEVVVRHVPVGLGSYSTMGARLDARIGAALLSIPAVKAVDVGIGTDAANRRGSAVHDAIVPAASLPTSRPSNRAGGIEGGISNGMPLVVRAHMKPLPTLRRSLPSVDLDSGEARPAHKERTDVAAVAACAVIAESMVSLVVLDALLMRYGGDHLAALTDAVARDRR